MSPGDEEFVPLGEVEDDLVTFDEEAAMVTQDEQKAELLELKAEGELPLDQLLLRYGIQHAIDKGGNTKQESRETGAARQPTVSLRSLKVEPQAVADNTVAYNEAVSIAAEITSEENIIRSFEKLLHKTESTKPLPHFPEPTKTKSHWLHTLEEMSWLSGDFSRERKWRKRSALKVATTLSKIRKREVQTDMKKAHEELVLARKTAKAIAGSILTFWNKANKVLSLQRQAADAQAQKMKLDAQLGIKLTPVRNFTPYISVDELVKVTEAYSARLAAKLNTNQPFPCYGGNVRTEQKHNIEPSIGSGSNLSVQTSSNCSSTDILDFSLLKHSLRDYQLEGVRWLRNCYINNLNVLLADEMGLGKTIQTIALLSMLATEFGNWGPHLIVVPTSVMLNWEVEFKKWCPALKVFTYFGSVRERRLKRHGWSKPNSFHVCITSYRIVTQDQSIFRRKNWEYLILDEAHMIKNWRSQRWQVLLNFSTKRRLLITGTPLQNELMELWALMHFLMPDLFGSHSEFKDWFANPMSAMVDGTQSVNELIVTRLHSILRPFILRRLKMDVEKTLPEKHEHIVKCVLSRRQRRLYEEYISSNNTLRTLASGNVMGVMNCLMQLRKVCNHPDLFAGRQICSPFDVKHVCWLSYFVLLTSARLKSARCGINLRLSGPNVAGNGKELNRYRSRDRIEEQHNVGTSFMENIVLPLSEVRAERTTFQATSLSFYAAQALLSNITAHTRYATTIFPKTKHLSQFGRIGQLAWFEDSAVIDNLIRFTFIIPNVRSTTPSVWSLNESTHSSGGRFEECALGLMAPIRKFVARQSMFVPDKRLVQFDCGKLQILATLLRKLKQDGHKALIFTQMTKMLDVLEAFLNLHGYTYCRLDGSTGAEQRQLLMQRFNSDKRLFVFILSTRSGGFGINLTGADTVIFYDSDWNPAMDQQAQDRCHRIGQTREVHIYRLISEGTIEESILQKAVQKRELDNMAIQLGNFNTTSFSTQQAHSQQHAVSGETLENEAMFEQKRFERIHDVAALGESAAAHTTENTVDEHYKSQLQSEDTFDLQALLPVEKYALLKCAAQS